MKPEWDWRTGEDSDEDVTSGGIGGTKGAGDRLYVDMTGTLDLL